MATAEVATSAPVAQGESRLVIHNISWAEYEALGKIFGDRPYPRMTYDRGTLELMMPSLDHELWKSKLDRVIYSLCVALEIEMLSGGATTFKREVPRERGLEPDTCYWIASEPMMRGKRSYEPDVDPPPDLAVEVECSRSALNKMAVYAGLGFPEVWRYDGEHVRVLVLGPEGRYNPSEISAALPDVPMSEVGRWVRRGAEVGETTLFREIAAWVQAGMPR